MACFHPLTAWRSVEGYNPSTHKRSLTFDKSQGIPGTELQIPCGQCIGCRLERSRQWAIRCVHEASLHDNSQFLTLTFSDNYLPSNGSLDVLILQKFLKRYRKMYSDISIRFYACGEYGDLFFRPHYHVIIFGHDFDDKELYKMQHGFPLYNSESLSKLWPFGHAVTATCTFESCAYCARYVTKKITGKAAENHYKGLKPEFNTMSRRPGIAHDWYKQFSNDVYPHDYVIIRDGLKCRPPRYYDNLYDVQSPDMMKVIKEKRFESFEEHSDNNTPDRLNVRERIQQLKADKLIRPFETL